MADSPAEVRALLDDAIQRRADDTDLPRLPRPGRTPSANTPFQAVAYRTPRGRTYQDPTGQQAVGNIKKKEKR